MKNNLILLFATLLCSTISYAQGIIGSWHGKLDFGGQEIALSFKFSIDGNKVPSGKMNIPQQGVKDIPVNISLLTPDSVSLQLPAIGMSYSGKLEQDKIKGTFKQNGITLPLDLEQGNVDKPNRPQEPIPPYPYKTEEVSFTNAKANAVFSGTLTLPIEYTPDKSVPVVLMVSGSGPQDRDENIYGHKLFLVIADYLAKNGIATLRYDDRGVGKSTGSSVGCTSEDFAGDADSGLQWIKNNGNYRFSKVGVLGHSEGGSIAFMLASENKVDFVVSMAGPGIKGDTLLAEQQNAILKNYGRVANRTVKSVRDELKLQPKDSWMDYFINYDPATTIANIKIPVMAINGSNDMQVISSSNLNAIRELLKTKNKKNFFKEYAGLNHLFQHCQLSNSLDYYNIDETCSEEVLKDIAGWINGL